jgi:MFS family permease
MKTAARNSAYAWVVVGLLFPVALLNYLDRQIFATMQKSILAGVPDIATDARFGELMAVFLYVYGIFSPVGGYIADRFNRRWVVIASLGIWSAITWLTGHAQTYDQLWWARALMGLSEACYIPAALALIADFHSGGTRARAVGIHQAGIYAGIILGGMGGYIADSSYGWRAGFQWFGLAGVVYAVVLLFFLRTPSPAPGGAHAQPAISIGFSLRQLLGVGAFLLLVLYFTLPAMPGWVVKSWMPKLLAETFHLGQGIAGVSATLWVTLASLAGVLIGGVLSDLWLRRSPRGRLYVSAIGTALCIPALFGIGYAPSLTVAVVFLVLYGIGFGFFDTNNMPILCQIVSPQLRATGYGLMNMVSVIVGGFAVKQVGVMRDSGAPPSAIFSICAIAAALAVIMVLLIRPRQNIEPTD